MNILIVGAGAVGQVYGRHLSIGGARVSFLVRPKYKDAHKDGFTIYPLRSKGAYEAVRFKPDQILSSLGEVKNETWDQVWLCVPSTALVRPWLDEVVAAIGDATLVLFPSGIDVVEQLLPILPSERCVSGLIPMMSYFAPMEGEQLSEPGVAYWFPPLSPTALSGSPARRDAVIDALKRGKCSAAAHRNVREVSAFGAAVLIPHVVALEGAHWSYEALASEHWLVDSVSSTREAIAAAAAHLKISVPFVARFFRPWTMRILLRIVRFIAPLDVAAFFKSHFTKVREQSKMQMAEYIALGVESGQSVTGLTRLTDDVFGAGWRKS